MKKRFFILSLFTLLNVGSYAQCAMCGAVAESSSNQGLMEGLNSGIIFLMAIPYLLFLAAILIFFRKPLLQKLKNKKEFVSSPE